MAHSRASAVRIIASSLAFDSDPPVLRSLDKARNAARAIVDALIDSQILDSEQFAGPPAEPEQDGMTEFLPSA